MLKLTLMNQNFTAFLIFKISLPTKHIVLYMEKSEFSKDDCAHVVDVNNNRSGMLKEVAHPLV